MEAAAAAADSAVLRGQVAKAYRDEVIAEGEEVKCIFRGRGLKFYEPSSPLGGPSLPFRADGRVLLHLRRPSSRRSGSLLLTALELALTRHNSGHIARW